MIEWIVILTWIINPPIVFLNHKEIVGDRIDKVYISSDTQTFSNQWMALTKEERENATVIKGMKYVVLPELKLEEEKSFNEILDDADNLYEVRINPYMSHCSFDGIYEKKTGKRIEQKCFNEIGRGYGIRFCEKHSKYKK